MRYRISYFLIICTLAVLSACSHSLETRQREDALVACHQISAAISSHSAVFAPESPEYSEDIEHWVSSSSQPSVCSVEPGNVEDLSKILLIIASHRVPFAVKGGGHIMNPGFSSTRGVHIAMSRFSEINYDASTQTVDVGAGLAFNDVYDALEPFGVTVVGARLPGIGVAGFTLGGGFSWFSNDRGLAVDNVLAFGLVLPNGTYTDVNESSNPDLFFGLKGGSNNFGIVTKFTFKTYPQGQVWGGTYFIRGDYLDKVNAAISKFTSPLQDPKASLMAGYTFSNGSASAALWLFYNGPTPAPGTFDDILAIPAYQQNVSTQSFASLIRNIPNTLQPGARGVFNTLSLTSHPEALLKAVVNETTFWGESLISEPGISSTYILQPFLPSAFTHGPDGSSAFPFSHRLMLPACISYIWTNSTLDALMYEVTRRSTRHLALVAEAEGQDIADLPLYGNYAIFRTPLERIYGENLGRLRSIKRQYDPNNVMALTGGWKF